MRELVPRPARFPTAKAHAPQQAGPCRLDGEQKILQVFELQLARRPRESRQCSLDALVVNQTAVDRQHRMGPHAVKTESPSARGRKGLELAADPISPGVVHAEHRCIGRETQTRSRPRFLDDLALQVQLMRVRRVLQLAASACAEVRTRCRDPMRRGFDHACRGRHRDPALPAPRLRFHHLARQRVVDEPDLAVVPCHSRAAVRGRRRLEDQRRQRETGSRAGLKPAASTIWVARLKPAAILSGSWASLAYWTAWPPTSRHQRTTVMSGQRTWPRVVFTSSTRPVRAAADNTALSSASKSFSRYGVALPSGQYRFG